jgi:hypothetical protein
MMAPWRGLGDGERVLWRDGPVAAECIAATTSDCHESHVLLPGCRGIAVAFGKVAMMSLDECDGKGHWSGLSRLSVCGWVWCGRAGLIPPTKGCP